jgi:Zinc finger, C2H2 type
MSDPKTCFKCGKVFKFQSNLTAHTARKRPCVAAPVAQASPQHICAFCNNIFAKKHGLAKHLLSCPVKRASLPQASVVDPVAGGDLSEISQLRREMKSQKESLERKIRLLELRLVKLEGAEEKQADILCTIRDYDKPIVDIASIRPSAFKYYKSKSNYLIKMMELIWFNPAAPHNHSIYVKNQDTMLRTNGKWQTMRVEDFISEATLTIDEITRKYFTELMRQDEYRLWLERDSPQLFDMLSRFMEGQCLTGHDVNLVCGNSEYILPDILKLDPSFPG